MKKKYSAPVVEDINFSAADSIASGCWTYSGTSDTGCENFADWGVPELCIPGFTEGTPVMGAS